MQHHLAPPTSGGDWGGGSGSPHKPSLKAPGSPPGNKDLRVRFAENTQVQEFASPSSTTATATIVPNAAGTTGGVSSSCSSSSSYFIPTGATANNASPAPSNADWNAKQQQQQPHELPPPPFPPVAPQQQHNHPYAGYYYNPYAMAASYYTHQAHHPSAWPTNIPQAAPAPSTEQQQDHHNNKMQLLARSVSITVNSDTNSTAENHHTSFASSQQAPHVLTTTTPLVNDRNEEEEEHRMLKKALCRLRHCTLRQVFRSWINLCQERWWKTQIALRDQQSQLLAVQLRHLEARPVRYLKRYRWKRWIQAWVAYCDKRRAKKVKWSRAEGHYLRMLLHRGVKGWEVAVAEERRDAPAEKKAASAFVRRRKRWVVHVWRLMVGRREAKEATKEAATDRYHTHLLRLTLGVWAHLAHFYATEKKSTHKCIIKIQSKTFQAWRNRVATKKRHVALLAAHHHAHARSLCAQAFMIWVGYVDGHVSRTKDAFYAEMSSEMERLSKENDRLTKVVDTGECWGRELTQVLQQERDALLKVVEQRFGGKRDRGLPRTSFVGGSSGSSAGGGGGSRRGSLAATTTTATPAKRPPFSTAIGKETSTEVATGPPSRKNSVLSLTRTTSTAPDPAPAPAPVPAPPSSHTTDDQPSATTEPRSAKGPKPVPIPANLRNKLTIKAGSNFNAMVRALKQDLISNGALLRADPSVTYAIDQLSTQKVSFEGDSMKISLTNNTNTIKNNNKGDADGSEGDSDGRAGVLNTKHPMGGGGRSVAFGRRLMMFENSGGGTGSGVSN